MSEELIKCSRYYQRSYGVDQGTHSTTMFDGDTPSCFDGLTTYNHSEILTELAKSAWTEEE